MTNRTAPPRFLTDREAANAADRFRAVMLNATEEFQTLAVTAEALYCSVSVFGYNATAAATERLTAELQTLTELVAHRAETARDAFRNACDGIERHGIESREPSGLLSIIEHLATTRAIALATRDLLLFRNELTATDHSRTAELLATLADATAAAVLDTHRATTVAGKGEPA